MNKGKKKKGDRNRFWKDFDNIEKRGFPIGGGGSPRFGIFGSAKMD